MQETQPKPYDALGLGGESPPQREHLERLRALVRRYAPAAFSEHLAWSGHGGVFLNDLLPLPYDEATLARVCDHVDRAQERLRVRMLLVGSFVAPAVALGAFDAAAATGDPPAGFALVAFVFYVLAYFVAIFFNTALVGAAMIRMDGGNPTLRDGLAIDSIAAFGRFSASVGRTNTSAS